MVQPATSASKTTAQSSNEQQTTAAEAGTHSSGDSFVRPQMQCSSFPLGFVAQCVVSSHTHTHIYIYVYIYIHNTLCSQNISGNTHRTYFSVII
jgi:hypothetical protein